VLPEKLNEAGNALVCRSEDYLQVLIYLSEVSEIPSFGKWVEVEYLRAQGDYLIAI
jgi:hypothetical protein